MPPRLLRPKDEPGASDDSEPTSTLKLSKRKAVSTACIPCRKRKSKCDGALPACSTCTAVYRTECNYDAESDHRRKVALKRDIQSLQQQNSSLEVIVASLRSLPESESLALLHSLRIEANPEILAAALRRNAGFTQNLVPQRLEADLAQQTPTDHILVGRRSIASQGSSTDDSTSGSGIITPGTATWFRQPQDAEFIEHLLDLYFCWVHPFYQIFSRNHFLRDMSQGNTDFCSAMLVNAILSLGCQYSDRTAARPDPGDPMTTGDHFFAEAKELLYEAEKSSVTTVHALGVMAIRQASKGRDSNCYLYVGRSARMALELGLHLSAVGNGRHAAEKEVRELTYWGVFNLETLCSVTLGRFSQLPRAAADMQRPAASERSEFQTWRPYEDTNLATSPSAEQPLRSMLFLEQLSTLSELASEMVNTFYALEEKFTSRRLAATYARYHDWYRNLPDAFRLENTTLPHVLVLHMHYYACVLQLFRPYIKLNLSDIQLFPRDTCILCANEISGLMSALRSMFGLRRVCLPVVTIMLSASTIHLLNIPSETSASHLGQALHDFHAMSTNHQSAARCIEIVRSLAQKWSIGLPDSAPAIPTFRSNSQQPWLSPSSSTFWAACIPRDGSAGSARSKGSMSGHASPFKPPPRPTQQQNVCVSIMNDPSIQLDPTEMQDVFWMPFPGQAMPVQPHHVVQSMSMDLPGMDGSMWRSEFGASVGGSAHHLQPDPRQFAVSSGRIAEGMVFDSWHWQ